MTMPQLRSTPRIIGLSVGLLLGGTALAAWAAQPAASTDAASTPTPAAAAAPAPAPAPAPLGKLAPGADLRQLMRGVFFPASNVIFAAQDDPSTFKQAEDAAVSPNPLPSIYGGWQSVQDAALALSDATNLLLLPGRLC